MDWKADYASKVMTAAEALKVVKSGDRVVFAHACGEPLELVDALVARAPELRDVEIVHMVAMGKGEYAQPEYAESFFHNSVFVGASTREAVHDGRGDYTPIFFHEIPGLFPDGYLPPDVVLVHVSPPDKHGLCSFGISVDYTKPAASVAEDGHRPGQPEHAAHARRLVHPRLRDRRRRRERAPIIELPPPKIGPVEEAIGKQHRQPRRRRRLPAARHRRHPRRRAALPAREERPRHPHRDVQRGRRRPLQRGRRHQRAQDAAPRQDGRPPSSWARAASTTSSTTTRPSTCSR